MSSSPTESEDEGMFIDCEVVQAYLGHKGRIWTCNAASSTFNTVGVKICLEDTWNIHSSAVLSNISIFRTPSDATPRV